MIVRLLTERRRGTEAWSRGDTLDVPDDEAARLIEQGDAVPVVDQAGREQRREGTGCLVLVRQSL